jgi:hypothetical protein
MNFCTSVVAGRPATTPIRKPSKHPALKLPTSLFQRRLLEAQLELCFSTAHDTVAITPAILIQTSPLAKVRAASLLAHCPRVPLIVRYPAKAQTRPPIPPLTAGMCSIRSATALADPTTPFFFLSRKRRRHGAPVPHDSVRLSLSLSVSLSLFSPFTALTSTCPPPCSAT